MMRKFLETYNQAVNLDDKFYNQYFAQGVDRSDFLLFDNKVICEFKEIQNIQIPIKVEKLSRKENLSEQNLKRDLYNSLEKALSKANKQIQATKTALNLPNALGLIILENQIADDLSALSLIDASTRKIIFPEGLVYTDCVLCLDFVNTFSSSETDPVRLAQTVSRSTEPAKKLSSFLDQFFLDQLMKDFCEQSEMPLFENWNIEKGDQSWFIDSNGKYRSYSAKVDFELPSAEEKHSWLQQLDQLLKRWWWVIPLSSICHDWFMR